MPLRKRNVSFSRMMLEKSQSFRDAEHRLVDDAQC